MTPDPINLYALVGVAKPYKFILFGARYVTKPYKFIVFGARYVTKPYEFIGVRGHGCHQTPVNL